MAGRKSGEVLRRGWPENIGGATWGGPGEPDYIRGDTQGEAKQRQRPLTKAEVMAECRKGRNEIVCNAGFTESAIEYVRRYRPSVKLIRHR